MTTGPMEREWLRYRSFAIPRGQPEVVVDLLRETFLHGAYGLYLLMMKADPTNDDLFQRLDTEMRAVEAQMVARFIGDGKGRA